VAALLIPAKLRHAGYASTLRRVLAATTSLHAVADTPPDDAKAFDATVYPMALVTRKTRPLAGRHTSTTLDPGGPAVAQSSLEGDGPWMLAGDVVGRVAERLAVQFPPFRARWRCALGVKTGADDVYLTREPDIEPQLLRRAVRGRDIKPGTVTSTLWLRWPCDELGNALRTLPPRAAAYFKSKRDRLSRRSDYRDGPPWTLFRTRAALGAHRVVWPDLARRLEAAALSGYASAFVPMNTCYVLNAGDGPAARVIAALLNSTWIRALATVRAPLAAGGFRRFNARVIEELPLPPCALEDPALMRAATAAPSEDSAVAVDDRAAILLELTVEERNALSAIVAPRRC